MKRLLTAVAAVALLSGAAYAQTATPAAGSDMGAQPPAAPTDPTASASPTGDMGAQAGAQAQPGAGGSMSSPPTSSTDQGGGSTAAPAPTDGGGSMAAPAGGGSMAAPAGGADTGATQTANTPSPAPGAYPRCTHKGQDRCTQSAAAAQGGHKAHTSKKHKAA